MFKLFSINFDKGPATKSELTINVIEHPIINLLIFEKYNAVGVVIVWPKNKKLKILKMLNAFNAVIKI